MIKGIERFRTELQVDSFFDGRVLKQSNIKVIESGGGKEPPVCASDLPESFWKKEGGFEVGHPFRGVVFSRGARGEIWAVEGEREGAGPRRSQQRAIIHLV